MTQLDSFARQLVAMVREMPDEVLLDLVRNHLEDGGATSRPPSKPAAKAKANRTAKPRRQKATKKRTRSSRGDRTALLDNVEAFVRDSKGVGLSDVAQGLSEPKSRVQAALRDLKKAGRVASAGDRRFTRYGKDVKTAKAASKRARGG